jgi:hypothetical protein
MDDLKGPDYVRFDNRGYMYIDSNLIANNYGGKTGLNFFGSAKINFDKYSITRAVGFISYNSFNTFQPKKNGNTTIYVNQGQEMVLPITYNYDFSNLALGFGLEVAPLSFTNVVSPFFNTNVSLNFMSASLERLEGAYDTNRLSMSDFRIGVNFNAGIEVKINNQWGIVGGVKYDLGNLIGKNTNRSISDRYEWGRTNASINDDEGVFWSNIPLPINGFTREYQSKEKKINWGTIYIGFNFYPSPITKSKTRK